ncbi:hypothetical protein ACFC1R_34220 [Kitasatospora sp. NPDC056138]|uniref:hypothetical protein n=1 Tax=Kitasatospora sp. NPDC056138 TaxID=3345724 RepID=UPI0035DDF83A
MYGSDHGGHGSGGSAGTIGGSGAREGAVRSQDGSGASAAGWSSAADVRPQAG